jgi:hypothetical protein
LCARAPRPVAVAAEGLRPAYFGLFSAPLTTNIDIIIIISFNEYNMSN